ncbi:MAG: prolyl oligopeptidase family serine peptidase [Clostridia bacterium]|nr:prolyl oligopeptidase family serine peptidase [Clostridia bacterium]
MNCKDCKIDNIPYFIRFPEGFDENKRYPVIILLHGAGSRGEDLSLLKQNAFFEIINQKPKFDFVTFAPQCPENKTWYDFMPTLVKLVDVIENTPFADIERLYLMGPSMGGYGTWQLAMSIPEHFAAIVPICGGGMYWNAGRLDNVPVWAFHGALDKTVLPEESEKMVNKLISRGADARLTVYPKNSHNAWSDTYSNDEVFEWLLSHKNQNNKALTNDYNDKTIYG